VRIVLIFSSRKRLLILFGSPDLIKLYYITFLFRFAVSPELRSGAGAIYPFTPAFRADFKNASYMMKTAGKDIAFGAPCRFSLCKDRLGFLPERQRGIISAVYPNTAFDA
jgi:hypothetical protein